jgi:hypothetical protein
MMQNAQTNETIDTRNILMKELVVVVLNEQDTAPVFQQLPHLIELSELTKPVSDERTRLTNLSLFKLINCD